MESVLQSPSPRHEPSCGPSPKQYPLWLDSDSLGLASARLELLISMPFMPEESSLCVYCVILILSLFGRRKERQVSFLTLRARQVSSQM